MTRRIIEEDGSRECTSGGTTANQYYVKNKEIVGVVVVVVVVSIDVYCNECLYMHTDIS